MLNADSISQLADAIDERLAERLRRLQTPPQRFLDVEQSAAYSSHSEKSIRRLLSSGKLTALRPVGRKVVIDIRELDAHILSSKKTPRKRRGSRG